MNLINYQYVSDIVAKHYKIECFISTKNKDFHSGNVKEKDILEYKNELSLYTTAFNEALYNKAYIDNLDEKRQVVRLHFNKAAFGSDGMLSVLLINKISLMNKIEIRDCVDYVHFLIYQQLFQGEIIYDSSNNKMSLECMTHKKYIDIDVELLESHHELDHETKIMDAISNGSERDLILSIRQFPKQSAGILSQESALRSLKNNIIATIAVAIRAAIKGGVHFEVAYSLSDKYIQQIEAIYNEEELISFYEKALLDLCNKVKLRYTSNYSRAIYTCILYIQTHLHENISLIKLAKLVKQHPKYISFQFYKETGMSYSTYIQKLKIEEASYLLLFSNESISVIAEKLNFYDQSHFSKTFKKWTGYTPKDYQMNQGYQSSMSKTFEIV